MSVPLSSGKGQQTIRVTSRPNAPKAFATDKIFLLRSVFYRRRALPFPPHRLPFVALETKPAYSEL